jgi:hypothetical protein
MTAMLLLLYRQRDELATDRAAVNVLQMGRATEIKAVREKETMKCWDMLSDLMYRYRSYYTAPFACLLASFSDTVSAV